MRIKNAKRWAPPGSIGYFVALGAILFAFIIRYVLHDALGPLLPFATFAIAVLLIEFRYGMGPALMALALSTPIGFYFFVPPYLTFDITAADLADILVELGYSVTMGLTIFLIELLQRSRYEARLHAEVSRTRYEVLLRSESERQSAVTLARQSRERFKMFANNVGEVIYMKRLGGGFEYVSDTFAKLTGKPVESLLGGNWLTVMHPEDAASIEEQIVQISETLQPTLSEFRLRTQADTYVLFEGKMSAMEDERGLILRWTGGLVESANSEVQSGD